MCLVVGDDVEGQMARYRNGEFNGEDGGYWDWYVIGGRWDGELILKDGTTTNEAVARDVDWEAMDDRNTTRLEKARERAKEYEDKYGKPDPFFEDHEPRPWHPFALLVDGLWRQQGTLIWFGEMADDGDPEAFREGFHEYRTSIASHRKLTIVDYHQ